MRKFIYLLLLPVVLISCKDQQKTDQETIENYISAHHLNAIAEPGGLYYVPVANGSGGLATNASQVTVTYKGYLTNDSVFQTSNVPYTTALYNTIEGWQEGIPLMQKGGRCTLLIPSGLGYGNQGQAPVPPSTVGIPPNSVLIFDIYLLNFQ